MGGGGEKQITYPSPKVFQNRNNGTLDGNHQQHNINNNNNNNNIISNNNNNKHNNKRNKRNNKRNSTIWRCFNTSHD